MAAPKVKFKRSSVAGKIPALSNLETGELALNTYDGKLFLKVDTGGIGIGTTVSTVNPWVENYGATGISYDGRINISGITTFTNNVNVTGTTTLGVVTSVTSIQATTYYGDGSKLTGISAGSTANVSTNTLVVVGVSTVSNLNVTGTGTTSLIVNGDARITGILTVGSSSLTLDGTNDIVNVGAALTLSHNQGIQFHTQNLHRQGFDVNNVNATGIITATAVKASGQFYPPTITTSERDALTVTQGALIFNTTENKVQMYLGSEWKSLAFELNTYTSIGI